MYTISVYTFLGIVFIYVLYIYIIIHILHNTHIQYMFYLSELLGERGLLQRGRGPAGDHLPAGHARGHAAGVLLLILPCARRYRHLQRAIYR